LGNRPNGFIPFEYELTKFVNKSGNNVLAVKVDHKEFADSRWYTGSGIYRNVYLFAKNPVYIPTWGVQFSSTGISKNQATAHTKVSIENAGNKNSAITLLYNLKDGKGNIAAKDSKQVTVNPGSTISQEWSFTISNPILWSVENPALYELSVTLVENGKTIDSYIEKVGIRSIRIDAKKGFFLNEENLKLKGVCIHDDAGALGVAVPEAVWRRRLTTLKELGCNSIRMSHNPHADYLYRLCDELGFLVQDEAFDEWETGKNKWIKGWNVGQPGKDGYHEYFREWANIDVRDMILRNYNHPSIIMWSIGNEIDYPNDPYSHEVLNTGNNPQIYGKGYLPDHPAASRLGELSKQLVDVVKKYDTTRPVTAALAGVVMSNTTSYPDNLDWVGYNYQEYRYADDHAQYPNRIIYGSENGMALRAWNAVDSNEYISAQYLWTGIDYLGEAGRWPQRSNGAGLMDLAGLPKPEYYFRQSLWSSKPMIFIGATKVPKEEDRSIWRHQRAEPNWNGTAGEKIRIQCFTNCSEAELFVNNKSMGRKAMKDFPGHVIYWDLAYEPGEVKVMGYQNEKETVIDALKTTGVPAAIHAHAEKDTAGKTNLVHVIINITDKDGNSVYNADNELTFNPKVAPSCLVLKAGTTAAMKIIKQIKERLFMAG
jgi:hypothetical protein